MEPLSEEWTQTYKINLGHIIKMAAMSIYSPNIKHLLQPQKPIILKLGMQRRELELYKFNINYDLGLTLTYFMARSNLVAYTFKWENMLQSRLMGEHHSKWLN